MGHITSVLKEARHSLGDTARTFPAVYKEELEHRRSPPACCTTHAGPDLCDYGLFGWRLDTLNDPCSVEVEAIG